MIALTFDDGPDPTWTPRVLDALDRVEGRATFYVVGEDAERHPDVVRAVVDAGHDVGLHCHRHVRHTDRDRPWLERDTAHALAVLADLGVRPTTWRTPWGIEAPWTATVARERGLVLVRWDADTHDWRGDAAQTMHAAIEPDLRPGAIVLAHDGLGPGARRVGCAATVALVGRLAAAGWELAGVDEVLAERRDRRAAA